MEDVLAHRKKILSRIMPRVVVDPDTGCWLWQGATNESHGLGYPVLKFHSKRYYVHRVMAALFDRAPSADEEVCHVCDTPRCIRPLCLFIDNHQGNFDDAVAKGRFPTGENNKDAVLTQAQADEIRRLYKAGGVIQRELGARFGVCQSLVSGIVNNKRYPQDPA